MLKFLRKAVSQIERGNKMAINSITIRNDGYINCKSVFYTAKDGLNKNTEYVFSTGINKLEGDIDSGIWAVSYLLSMYKPNNYDFVLFDKAEAQIDTKTVSLKELKKYACYLDETNPFYSKYKTVKQMVENGIKKSKLNITPDEIRDMFMISPDRFERKLSCVGNEVFKAMSAIGYSYGKQVFCFPWISKMRFDNFNRNITDLLEVLQNLKTIIVLPVGC